MVFILSVLIFLLTGCGGPVSSSGNSKIITGYKGITLQFMEGNFEDVFEESPFGISYYLSNEGTADVKDGVLKISYNTNAFNIVSPSVDTQDIVLNGKTVQYPYPEEKYYESLFETKKFLKKLDYSKENIKFGLCYPYTTSFATTTCIDTRTSTQDQRIPACTSKTISGGQGQGAPIAVTKVESEMLIAGQNNIRPQFKIYVANMGTGRAIYSSDTQNTNPCTSNNYDFDTISINAYLSDRSLICVPSKLKISSGESYFRCTNSNNDIENFPKTTLNYVAPLRVVLNYYYIETINYPITVKRVIDNSGESLLGNNRCQSKQVFNSNTASCEYLCTYCITNKNSNVCSGINGIDTLKQGFECKCTYKDCTKRGPYGGCLLNLCEGDTGCCIEHECAADNSDGEPCNDNHACKDGKCTPTTLCEYYEGNQGNQGNQGKSCNMLSNCDMATVENGLCPLNGGVCCKKATKNCDTKYQVEYNGECMDLCIYCSKDEAKTDSRCTNILSKSEYDSFFSCLIITSEECTKLESKGLCIKGYCKDVGSTSKYCAKPESLFCVGKTYGTGCGDNYVCDGAGKCMSSTLTESQCAYYSKTNPSNYGVYSCMLSDLCRTGTVINLDGDGYCPNEQTCCIKNDGCYGKPDGEKCGDNYACIGQYCSSETYCEHNRAKELIGPVSQQTFSCVSDRSKCNFQYPVSNPSTDHYCPNNEYCCVD